MLSLSIFWKCIATEDSSIMVRDIKNNVTFYEFGSRFDIISCQYFLREHMLAMAKGTIKLTIKGKLIEITCLDYYQVKIHAPLQYEYLDIVVEKMVRIRKIWKQCQMEKDNLLSNIVSKVK